MLKNRLFIALVGITLVIALIYNIRFFAHRGNTRLYNQGTSGVETAFASLPSDSERKGTEGNSTPVPLPFKPSVIVDTVSMMALESTPWGRNPFLTLEEESAPQHGDAKKEGDERKETTTVQGILIGYHQRVAIIDHTVVTEGDWIGGEQIIKIDRGKVVLAMGKNQRVLVMEESPITISVKEGSDEE
jgi:hypothetical protein